MVKDRNNPRLTDKNNLRKKELSESQEDRYLYYTISNSRINYIYIVYR